MYRYIMCNVAVTSIQLVWIVKVCLCIKINNQGLCSIGLHFSWFRNICQHYAFIASGPYAIVLYIFAMVATMPLIEPLNMKLTSSIEIHDGLICSSKSDLLLFCKIHILLPSLTLLYTEKSSPFAMLYAIKMFNIPMHWQISFPYVCVCSSCYTVYIIRALSVL